VIGTRLVVDPEQAAVVVEIFENYASDQSPRSVAATLNARGVPSPGSAWRGRTVRRAAGWLGSTINSMLENPLYRGEYAWNRTAWIKNPDSGARVVRVRPVSEWVRHQMPELRIVADALWHRMEARRRRAAVRGAAVSAGIRASASTGRGPKFAFSGLLKCEQCGSSMVIVGGSGPYRSYGCAGYSHGRTCTNAATAKLIATENKLAAAIKDDLLTPALLADLESRVAKKLAAPVPKAAHGQRIADLRGQVNNLTDAIATGALRASPALGARLADAEAELARLEVEAARPKAKVIDFPAKLTATVRKAVDRLVTYLRSDPHRARAAVREIVGEIPCAPDPTGRFLVARVGLSETLLRAVGATEIFVVAGGRFRHCLKVELR
jgi:site-specific DNA recombinase